MYFSIFPENILQLVLNTYGAYLSARGIVSGQVKDQSTEIFRSQKCFYSHLTGAAFSSDAVQLAVGEEISIPLSRQIRHPFGRVWHGRPGSTTAIRRMANSRWRKLTSACNSPRLDGRKFDNQIACHAACRPSHAAFRHLLKPWQSQNAQRANQDLADNVC